MTSTLKRVAPDGPDKILRNMLKAKVAENYDEFISRFTTGLKERLKKSIFFAVCEKVSAHLASGYEIEFLAELDQKSRRLYVWKLTFSDQAGELLVRLWLSPDNEVSGIMLDGANSL